MQETLMIGIPLVVIIAGILLNRQDVHGLRTEMRAGLDSLDAKMRAGFDLLHRDLREFDRTIGQHDARLDSLEERTKKP